MEYSHDKNCTCPGCLTWDDYDNIYIDFAMEYSRQMLLYTLSVELLSNFPMNLPQDLLIPIVAKRHQALTAAMMQQNIKPEPGFTAEDVLFKEAASIRLSHKQHRIRCAYEGLYNLARLGKKMPEMEFPQFGRFLVSQNIVVICAFAEGFIANTIRTLCEVRPIIFHRCCSMLSDQIMYLYFIKKSANSGRLSALENTFQGQKHGCKDFGIL